MKKFFCLVMLLSALVPVTAWGEEARLPAENMAQLVAAAIEHNPEVKSSQARWQMFANRARQASSLEDPMFMFKLQNLVAREPYSFGGTDPQTAKVIGISQQLPFWGKRALKQEIADS